jgi:hypothetical protein
VERRPAFGEVVGELCAARLGGLARSVECEGTLDRFAGRWILADDDTDLEDARPPFAQRASPPRADDAESRAISRVTA